MRKIHLVLVFTLCFLHGFSQFKEHRNYYYSLPKDSSINPYYSDETNPEPINNKVKQAQWVENGKIKVYVSDVTYSTSKYNSVNHSYSSRSHRRVMEYILTDKNRLIKLNYKHLKHYIHDDANALNHLNKAKRGRYKKYVAYLLMPASCLPLILDNSKDPQTLRNGLIAGAGVLGFGITAMILRMKNRGHLYDAIIQYNHPGAKKKN